MSDQTQEKEKSLAELMVRILKEPLKPLGESVQGLEAELSDIKAELEQVSGNFADGLKKNDDAAKRRSKEALDVLDALKHEQAEWTSGFRSNLAELAQTLDARLSENLTARAQSESRLLNGVASVEKAQLVAAHSLAAIPEQLSDNRAAVDNVVLQLEVGLAKANTAMASGFTGVVAEICQRLERQHKSVQAVHQVLLNGMKVAAEHAQAETAANLQAGQALRDSLANDHIGIINVLNQHAEALNARLDQNEARLRQLTITTGILFVSILTYAGYELLLRFI